MTKGQDLSFCGVQDRGREEGWDAGDMQQVAVE
jgi:hypothetical protein